MIYLQPRISTSQHGFMKGRGTLTAWEEILTKVINSNDIYEYDLRNCFEELSIRRTVDLIREIGIPEDLAIELESLNESGAKLPKDKKLEEKRAEAKLEYGERKEKVIGTIEDDVQSCYTRLLTDAGGRAITMEILIQTGREIKEENAGKPYDPLYPISRSEDPAGLLGLLTIGEIDELIEKMGEETDRRMAPGDISPNLEEISEEKRHLIGTGFAQGSPISPILAAFNINYTVLGQVPHVMYADDGLLYDIPGLEDTEPEELDNAEHGVFLNKEKSGWVKKGGQ